MPLLLLVKLWVPLETPLIPAPPVGARQIAFPEASAVKTSPEVPETFGKSIVPSFKVPATSNLPGNTVAPSSVKFQSYWLPLLFIEKLKLL